MARAAGQRLGRLHTFEKATPLERFTLRPQLDQREGLGTHSYWRRVRPGRIPSAATAKRELNVQHSLTHRETWIAPRGTKYHERPIVGAPRGAREVIAHDSVAGNQVQEAKRLLQSKTESMTIR